MRRYRPLIARLDSLDRKLLAIVQRDASLTSAQLSERIGLSSSAVQRRLNRLRKEGVIRACVAIVDAGKMGPTSSFIVGLEVERERPEFYARLKAWLLAEDEVQEVFYVTGMCDVILVVTTAGVEQYDEFMNRLMTENSNVRRFTTNVALAIHKRELFVRTDLAHP